MKWDNRGGGKGTDNEKDNFFLRSFSSFDDGLVGSYCRNILASLKAHGAPWFFYIGGHGTVETVRIVSEEAAKEGYDLRSIHIPKTIDNDLMENDHAPDFPSAARLVVQAFMGTDLDNRSLPGV
jgi:6-phosphofructokinase